MVCRYVLSCAIGNIKVAFLMRNSQIIQLNQFIAFVQALFRSLVDHKRNDYLKKDGIV